MEEYILKLFIQGTINELVVIKNRNYYATMEFIKKNLIANNIQFVTETLKNKTLVRRG